MELPEMALSYARFLDDRLYEDWLALFSKDSSYKVVLRENLERGSVLFIVSESKEVLARRIDRYRDVYHVRSRHLITNMEAREETFDRGSLSCYFNLFRDGVSAMVGQYQFGVIKVDAHWTIRDCVVVLDTSPVGIIQVPI